MTENDVNAPIADHKAPSRRSWPFIILGALLAAVGLALAVGGAQLALLGGSFYYLLTGLALTASGVLLARRKLVAIHLFFLVYAATVIWSFWEAGLSFWGWVPRFAPFLMMGLIIAALWPRLGGRKPAARLFGGAQIVLILAGAWGLFQPQGAIHPDGAAAPLAAVNSSFALPAEWSSYAGDPGGTHHAPIDQITPANVKGLKVAWTFRTGEIGETAESQVTPIQIGNSLYFCTARNKIFSLNAATGAQNWSYDPKVKGGSGWNRCRGVSYFDADASPSESMPAAAGSFCRQRIIGTTIDATMVALDARTGQLCPGFGEDGTVNLKQGMGHMKPGWYSPTSAPLIAKGHVIVGGWVSDNQSVDEPAGVVRAYSATTGKLLWAWNADHQSRLDEKDGDAFTRATPNFWGTATYDEKLGLIYIPTGTTTPDHWGALRTEADDRFSTAVVALRVDTGERAWVFQTVHHDLWDWDLAAPPTFTDMPDGKGGTIPAIVQVGKAGQIFVLDRATGKPITKVIERPVPQGGVPGEKLSPTQPYSVGMPQILPYEFSEKKMWGATFFDQLLCRIEYRKLDNRGQYTPPSLKRSIISPGYWGGFNWGGVSIDPARRLLILNDIRVSTVTRLVPRKEADALAQADPFSLAHAKYELHPGEGSPYGYELASFQSPFALPCEEPAWGKITAIDLATRKLVWQIPAGTLSAATRDRFGIPVPLPIGMPTVSAATTTASGLTFYAGFNDEHIRAYSTSTGKELWSAKMPVGAQATPMTYISPANRKQYLAVFAGGTPYSAHIGDYLIAYALPD